MNQKNSIWLSRLIITGVFLILAGACQKDNDDLVNGSDENLGAPVVITGTVNSTATGAMKVLAISSTDNHKMESIANNKFSIKLDNGKPWGLIFLSQTNQPLGLLSLGNGIENLPLPFIKQGTDTINLQTITRSNEIFTPSHNPIGNEIVMTNMQVDAAAYMDDYLAMILKNPDINNNGQIDVLEGKFYKLEVIYFIKPSRFDGSGLTPSFGLTGFIEGYRLFLTIKDKTFPETVYFSGPAGSPLNNTSSETAMKFNDHRVYSTPYLSNGMLTTSFIPAKGVYRIDIGGSTLTFDLPDQEYAKSNVVFPYPTVTLNSNGTINKVDWVYKMPSGASNNNLFSLIREIQIQIEGLGNKCSSSNQQVDRLYDSPKLSPGTVSHTLSCQNIVWGSSSPLPGENRISRVMMTYNDHYGASYVVMYNRNFN